MTISDYLLDHCTPADAVLADLAAETRRPSRTPPGMQISHDEGELLAMLVGLTGARNAVEVGVFTGYSAICIARGLPEDGRLLACDISEEWTALAQALLAAGRRRRPHRPADRPGARDPAGAATRPGDRLRLHRRRQDRLPAYYEELVPRLRPGGLLVLDNVLQGGRILETRPSHPAVAAMQHMNDQVVPTNASNQSCSRSATESL